MAAYLTGIVRLFYPLDKWVPFLYCIQLEPAHLVSYVFAFIAGIWAFRNQWLTKISKQVGWVLFLIGFLLSLFLLFIKITNNTYLIQWFDQTRFLYETIMGLSLIFGIVVLSRTFLNFTSAFLKLMANNAYGAYIFHVPIVIFFQIIFEKIPPHIAMIKFLSVSILAVVFSFFVSYLVRMIPGVKRILG